MAVWTVSSVRGSGGKQTLRLVRPISAKMCGDASIVTPCGSQHLGKVGVATLSATLWLQRTGKCAAHPSTYVLGGSGCDFSPRRLRLLRTWRFMCAMPSQGVMTRRQNRRLCRQVFQPASLLGARVLQRAPSFLLRRYRSACRPSGSFMGLRCHDR